MLFEALLLLSLLTWATVEVVHHGEICQKPRWAIHAWAESGGSLWRVVMTPLRSLACPYCFSHWVALGAGGVCPLLGLPWWWMFILWLPAARLANLANDLTAGISLTPGRYGRKLLKDATPEELEVLLVEKLEGDYEPTLGGTCGEKEEAVGLPTATGEE